MKCIIGRLVVFGYVSVYPGGLGTQADSDGSRRAKSAWIPASSRRAGLWYRTLYHQYRERSLVPGINISDIIITRSRRYFKFFVFAFSSGSLAFFPRSSLVPLFHGNVEMTGKAVVSRGKTRFRRTSNTDRERQLAVRLIKIFMLLRSSSCCHEYEWPQRGSFKFKSNAYRTT